MERTFDALCLRPVGEMTPKKIRALRTRERASQTVVDAYPNVTPGLVSKGERGEKRPQGASPKAALRRGEEGFGSRGLILSTDVKRGFQ